MKVSEKTSSWPLVGNSNITEFLSKSIAQGDITGSYIFSGPESLGKKTLAFFFAKVLLCQKKKKNSSQPCGSCPSCLRFQAETPGHSDLYAVRKEADKKNISIDQIREFIKMLSLSSFLDSYKIGLIEDADTLSVEAANALLKTLEEPRKNVVIILIAADAGSLPQTIVSRSQILRFAPVRTEDIYSYLVNEHKAPRSTAKHLSHLAAGKPALAVKLLEDKDFQDSRIKQAEIFLDFFQGDINDRFLAIEGVMGKKSQGQDSVKLARDMVSSWTRVLRDLLLMSHGQKDLVCNEILSEALEKTMAKCGSPDLLRIARSLRRAEELLSANVNPKTSLELVALGIRI